MEANERKLLILKFLPRINLERRIRRKRAFALIGSLGIVLTLTIFYAGNRWLWAENVSYYDYKTAGLQFLNKQTGSASIRAEIALNSYLKGDTLQSVKMLREVLTKEPQNGKATLYLGLILTEQKEYRESIALLTKYIKDNQDFTSRIAYESLGESYMGTGQYDLALEYLKLAAARDPGNPLVYYNLGRTYEQLKKPKDAMFSYEKALQISGSYPDAQKALSELETKTFRKISN